MHQRGGRVGLLGLSGAGTHLSLLHRQQWQLDISKEIKSFSLESESFMAQ